MKYSIITFGTNFLKSQQKLKYISFQAHDVGFEYSKNLMLNEKGLDTLNIRVTNWGEEKFNIVDYRIGNDEVGAVLAYQNIQELKEVTSRIDRQLLLLNLLHSIMLKLVVHYNWEDNGFEVAYKKTKDRIEQGDPLPSFLKYMMNG